MGVVHPSQACAEASDEVVGLWAQASAVAAGPLPGMGLSAGLRPAADVQVLTGALASVEYELARRMHAAASAGSLPLAGDGAMPAARGWSTGWARRLARAGALVADHPLLASSWADGLVTSEHVDALARHADQLAAEEMAAVIDELTPLWGQLSPAAVTRFVRAAIRMLHPPSSDPEPAEAASYSTRSLSFALLGDTVVLSGTLPRLEGELVMAAVDAFAERARTQADHVPASARRADGLVALVAAAGAAGGVPTRGGLPVALTVTLHTTETGDTLWTTGRGHQLTPAEQRFTSCDPALTPILLPPRGSGQDPAPESGSAAARVTALARTILASSPAPLAVGRTERTATVAQRRALAARDRGCVIPGCTVPPDACQTHHLTEWAQNGATDQDNLVLLCWNHHRQVDLHMWTIEPAQPDRNPPPRAWPGNNGSPWTIATTPRTRWRT